VIRRMALWSCQGNKRDTMAQKRHNGIVAGGDGGSRKENLTSLCKADKDAASNGGS